MYAIPTEPGLYDKNQKLLATWDELVNYGFNINSNSLEHGFADLIKNNNKLKSSSIIIISDHIENIEYQAFYRCSGLTNIIIPSSVTNIGEGAFSECDKLENIIFENGGLLLHISHYAFDGCTNLKLIKFPTSLSFISLSEYSFYDEEENSFKNIDKVVFENKHGWTIVEVLEEFYYENMELFELDNYYDLINEIDEMCLGGLELDYVSYDEIIPYLGSNIILVNFDNYEYYDNLEY